MVDRTIFLSNDHFEYIKGEPNKEFVNPEAGHKNCGDRYDDWKDEDVIAELATNDYILPRKLEDGSWVAIHRLITTWSVCCDIGRITPYAYRWCFEDFAEATIFLNTIKEFDEVPLLRQSLVGHRFARSSRLAVFDNKGLKKW